VLRTIARVDDGLRCRSTHPTCRARFSSQECDNFGSGDFCNELRGKVAPARGWGLGLACCSALRHNETMTLMRITIDPAVCTGKPCIRGLRFPVARLLGLLAAGETPDGILKAYPYLEAGDIEEALRYAAFLAEDETIELTPTS
jgi:uncharacterized protein (DUF433 family)